MGITEQDPEGQTILSQWCEGPMTSTSMDSCSYDSSINTGTAIKRYVAAETITTDSITLSEISTTADWVSTFPTELGIYAPMIQLVWQASDAETPMPSTINTADSNPSRPATFMTIPFSATGPAFSLSPPTLSNVGLPGTTLSTSIVLDSWTGFVGSGSVNYQSTSSLESLSTSYTVPIFETITSSSQSVSSDVASAVGSSYLQTAVPLPTNTTTLPAGSSSTPGAGGRDSHGSLTKVELALIYSGTALGGLLLMLFGLWMIRKWRYERRRTAGESWSERQRDSHGANLSADSPQEATLPGPHGEGPWHELPGRCEPAEMEGAQQLHHGQRQEPESRVQPVELPGSHPTGCASAEPLPGSMPGPGGHRGENPASIYEGQLFELE